MKTLDKYVLKSFLVPFFATFLIVLFVLVMQAVWLAFDDIAGKGISFIFILKFLWYTTLLVVPQALPIGVLLSSIMALGNLSEHYEFAATKSAGISLNRMVRPLVFLAIAMSIINFLFLNNIYPYAILKQKNLYINIKKTKPTLALIPGSFNTEIPNFHIKFDKKYGKNDNLLKNVMIYDLSSGRGNQKIITAKNGKIISKEGSRYMTLVLKNGYFFQDHIKDSYKQQKRMPDSNADFDTYTINIDISELSSKNLDEENFTKSYNMLSINQLKDTLPIMKNNYDEFINYNAKRIYNYLQVNLLHEFPDYIKKENIQPIILDNFNLNGKIRVIKNAITNVNNTLYNTFSSNKKTFKFKRKILNLYDVEFYNRVAFSLSCLILFFIGAPLGSIIRKGGIGLPMILAISIYVLYFFINTFGRNLAEESSVTAVLGSYISAIFMLPIGFLLTRRAIKDRGLFNINSVFEPIMNLLNYLKSKKHDNI